MTSTQAKAMASAIKDIKSSGCSIIINISVVIITEDKEERENEMNSNDINDILAIEDYETEL